MSICILQDMTKGEGNIGGRIRAIRESLGWTQETLAERAETLQENVARYETGMVKAPDPRILARIARALGVSLSFVVTGEREIAEGLFKNLARFDQLPPKSQEVIRAMADMIDQKILADLPANIAAEHGPPSEAKKPDVA